MTDTNTPVCEACNHPLGSNPECDRCLTYISEKGAEFITPNDVESTSSRERAWREGRGKTAPPKLLEGLKDLVSLIIDYSNGSYRKVPWGVIATAAFAVLYAVNPFDMVPDIIPGLGYLDDLSILTLVLTSLDRELEIYKMFRIARSEEKNG